MTKRLIFSDLHFGDRLCALRREVVTAGLRHFLRGLGQVKELILAGDILDANISSLTRAIEGVKGTGTWPKQMGFRDWLAYLFEGDEFKVDRIRYIPGNHDYVIWNILSTDKVFTQPISLGEKPVNLPLMSGKFPAPFIRGVAPKKLRNNFVVNYPDYVFSLGRRRVLVTHGHYLDEKQTLFKNLDELIKQKGGDEAKAVREFFKLTAQYQVVAHSISFMNKSREFVDKAHKTLSSIFNKINIIGRLRNQPINKTMLKAIEMYLCYFSKKQPDVFIFGHSHKPGRNSTKTLEKRGGKRLLKKVVEIWNIGSFIENPDENQAGFFILTDAKAPLNEMITLYEVDLIGNVLEKRI